jgi:hypothetical protein
MEAGTDGRAGSGGSDGGGGSAGAGGNGGGAPGDSGASPDAPDAGCRNDSMTCRTCISTNCTAQGTACLIDATCSTALGMATTCVCNSQNQTQIDQCEATFRAVNAAAAALETCVAASCKTQCGL